MKMHDARDLAISLMKEHNLVAWNFTFDKATRRFGYCSFRTRTISLSGPLTELNTEERVRNTVLHEIAHAIAPRGAHHGFQWGIIAQRIGCDAKPRYDENQVVLPPTRFAYKYVAICERHNIKLPKKMKKLGVACKRCCDEFNHGRFSAEYLFKWIAA